MKKRLLILLLAACMLIPATITGFAASASNVTSIAELEIIWGPFTVNRITPAYRLNGRSVMFYLYPGNNLYGSVDSFMLNSQRYYYLSVLDGPYRDREVLVKASDVTCFR